MTDQLTRAWNLLGERERPPGLNWSDEYGFFHERGYSTPHHVAYDRLCQAVEGVLMSKYDSSHDRNNGFWRWYDTNGDLFMTSDCRLTAACDAMESVR